MKKPILVTMAVILCGGLAQALPVNNTGTGCECYYDTDCPDTSEGKGVCWHGTGCDYHGDPFDPSTGKTLDGSCGFIGPAGGPASAGSSCAAVSPTSVAKVLKAWTSAFDKAGASGGGPIGKLTARAYKLSHQLIPSIGCRFDIARKAMDVQVLSRNIDFLQHPYAHHRVEDHSVQNISADKCRQQIGRLSSRALQLEILAAPEQAAAQLARIATACPMGQTLSSPCEGDADEIGCLGARLHTMAEFLGTAAHDTCGDGILGTDEQCEFDRDCPGARCIKCRCVTTTCGLALCGNGTVDPGEECDDGNTADNDPCVSCKAAVCGDGVVCNGDGCHSGRDGTPEQCDPPGPDTVHCTATCSADCSCN